MLGRHRERERERIEQSHGGTRKLLHWAELLGCHMAPRGEHMHMLCVVSAACCLVRALTVSVSHI